MYALDFTQIHETYELDWTKGREQVISDGRTDKSREGPPQNEAMINLSTGTYFER